MSASPASSAPSQRARLTRRACRGRSQCRQFSSYPALRGDARRRGSRHRQRRPPRPRLASGTSGTVLAAHVTGRAPERGPTVHGCRPTIRPTAGVDPLRNRRALRPVLALHPHSASSAQSRRSPTARTREAEDWVQLDPVRCDAGLAVDRVPEPDANDRDHATEVRPPGGAHTPAVVEESPTGASDLRSLERRGDARPIGELYDHRLGRLPRRRDHQVDIPVAFQAGLKRMGAESPRVELDVAGAPAVPTEPDLWT